MIIKNINQVDDILNTKKVFIFDFDGTLVETEDLSWKAHNINLQEYNIVLGDEERKRYIGNTNEDIYDMICKDFNINFDKPKMIERTMEIYKDLVNKEKLQPFDYFIEIYNKYENASYNILSANEKKVIEEMLGRWGLLSRIDKIISISDYKVSKLEFYQNVNKYFGCQNAEAVVFEDSSKYLKMAKENGIFTIGINSRYKYEPLTDYDVILDLYNLPMSS